MRIAMVAYTLYGFDPRVQRAACALAEGGHQVDVFAVSQQGRRHQGGRAAQPGQVGGGDGVPCVHLLRMRKRRAGMARHALEYAVFFWWAFTMVSAGHLRRSYDVVYAHNMPNFLVFTGLLPKVSGAKVVLDVHDPVAELLADMRGRGLGRWARRAVQAEERVSLSFADAVITVNESMRHRLHAVSQRQVTVVMNLPDRAPGELPRPAGGPGDWLVYSGSVAHRNGLDLAIAALSLLVGEHADLRLRVIGEGPALASVVRLAADLGVADRVEFTGSVPSDQVPSLVSGAVGALSPQRGGPFGSLVFSMKVPEYVALGLPVVCSGIPTMRHYFSEDELLFFEPGSAVDLARAVRELLADRTAARQRAACARAKLTTLDWAAQKQALVDTVAALAGARAGR